MLCSKSLWIVTVGLISLVFIFKKNLEELKSISYVFLTVVLIFVALLLAELLGDKTHELEPSKELMEPKQDY